MRASTRTPRISSLCRSAVGDVCGLSGPPLTSLFTTSQVKNVAEMGAYVSLLEYNGVEGMILLSELSRRRIRSINKLIRVGRTEVVVVLRVDQDKGYIDLSKRRVSPEDIQKCEEKYNKSKAVHSIIRHVSETCKVKQEDLYAQFGWSVPSPPQQTYIPHMHNICVCNNRCNTLRSLVGDVILHCEERP